MKAARIAGAAAAWLTVVAAAAQAQAVAPAAGTDASARPPMRSAGPEVPEAAVLPKFDGNHSGFLVGAGPTWLARPPEGVAERGLSFRVAGRLGTVMQLVDAEVALSHASHGGTGGSAWSRSEASLQLATHPAFPLLVFNDWPSDVLAGLHGFGSVSLVRATLTGTAAVAKAGVVAAEHGEWLGALSAGAGVDIPVTPRNLDWGLWLTLRYAVRWLEFGRVEPELNLGDGQFLVLVGWRTYRTNWARVPRPF